MKDDTPHTKYEKYSEKNSKYGISENNDVIPYRNNNKFKFNLKNFYPNSLFKNVNKLFENLKKSFNTQNTNINSYYRYKSNFTKYNNTKPENSKTITKVQKYINGKKQEYEKITIVNGDDITDIQFLPNGKQIETKRKKQKLI